MGLDELHRCPLRKIRLPKGLRWHTAGAPASPAHINLGEADAAVWSAEDRLRRPSDDNCRFVHPLDSASCCGAFSKGRSSSHLLNGRCRKMCAINIAGGHEPFYPWIPSEDNPADPPSRLFEISKSGPSAELVSAFPVVMPLLTMPRDWSGNDSFFIHFCSG